MINLGTNDVQVNNNDDCLLQFTNCRILRHHRLIHDDLWIRNGRIIDPEPVFFEEKALADIKHDCQNAIIAPGYIDLQINGGYGVDFSHDVESVEEGINKVAEGLIRHGVTSFCPTLVTSPTDVYRHVLPRIPKKTKAGSNVLGVHLEGPFINSQKKGAHPESHIRKLENGMETLMSIYKSLDNVKIVTLAPELDFSGEVVRKLTEMGITVSLGHSMGNLKDGEEAAKNGATLITHLFNAMLPFHHRDPGLVGLLASNAIPKDRTMFFGIIADGVHTHPAALRIAHRTHPSGLCLVTDAISAMGLEEGIHHIGQHKLQVKNGKAFVAGTETLCGSITPLDECVRIFKKATDCSIAYALEAATLHPAQCLKMENSLGTLNFGAFADFNILDDDLRILSTWIKGRKVYPN